MGVLLKRQHMRLAGYDYSRVGAYFVTLCAVDRKCPFGEIVADEMRLNQIGTLVNSCWSEIPKHVPNVTLDESWLCPITCTESCCWETNWPGMPGHYP
jgi:hypothetical protein